MFIVATMNINKSTASKIISKFDTLNIPEAVTKHT